MDAQFKKTDNTEVIEHHKGAFAGETVIVKGISHVRVRIGPGQDKKFIEIMHLDETDELVVLYHAEPGVEPEAVFTVTVPKEPA